MIKPRSPFYIPPTYKLDHPTEYLFTIDGIKHFRFKDISKTCCLRMFAGNDAYNELSMRCTRDYLEQHCKAMDAIMDGKAINIQKIAQLNLQLKERIDNIFETEIIYKIASIVIFDKTENPYDYDIAYSKEKIARFKKKVITEPYFITRLFKILIGSPDMSEKDLLTVMAVGEKISREHSAVISTMLSSKPGTIDYGKMSESLNQTEST